MNNKFNKSVWRWIILLVGLGCLLNISAQTVKVQYKCGAPEEFFYQVRPFISPVNTGEEAVDLGELKARYYYTKEGFIQEKLTIDWSPLSGATAEFYEGYLEIDFGSGSLEPGSSTGGLQLRMEKSGGGYYVQGNDYSFAPEFQEYEDFLRITLYRGGTLIWGNEPPPPTPPPPSLPADDDWLHTDGSRILDKFGNKVRLTGINWFGFETQVNGFYNFDFINWRYGLETIAELGFNLLRLPLSAELTGEWRSGRDPGVEHVNGKVNWDIDGITSLVFLDMVLDYCRSLGIKVMFDMHGIARSQNEATWLENGGSDNLHEAWRWLAARYKHDDTVIAMDLFNEPHGLPFGDIPGAAKWDGSGDTHNWRYAAEETAAVILAENPNVLIMVEWVEVYPKPGYTYASTDKFTYDYNWWGGNLRGAADYPVDLGLFQDKLVYSPHDYGPDIHRQPWFQGSFSWQSLYDECWDPNWFYLVRGNVAPVLIGEWGGKLENSDNRQWMELLVDFISSEELHHTFWCFGPNSGDTGGIIGSDWNTVDQVKYNIVEPALWKSSSGQYIGLDHHVNLGSTGTNVGFYYGSTTPIPLVTATPGTTSFVLLGDIDGDGGINILDALKTAQYYVGLEPVDFNPAAADVNRDGVISIVDALLIAQYYVGIIDGF